MLKPISGSVLMQDFNSFKLYFYVSLFHYWKPRKTPALSDNHGWWFNRNKDPLNTEMIFNIITCTNHNSKEKDYYYDNNRGTDGTEFMVLCINGVKSSQSLEHENAWMETDRVMWCAMSECVRSRCHPSTSLWQDGDIGQLYSKMARYLSTASHQRTHQRLKG